MSVPTEYDLTQDALIGPMRDILLTASEPPTGPEFSYPVVDQAVSSSMWKWITRGMGSGIIGVGGRPYWLYYNEDEGTTNSTRTRRLAVSAITGTANAVINGFFHQMSEDMILSFPMPSSGTVTYRVCLTYDPREESSPEGPISVQVYDTEPPSTFGREHVRLWDLTCKANQLLTDAELQQYRQFVAPSLSLNYSHHLPPPESVLSGTTVHARLDGVMWLAMQGNEAAEDGTPANPRWINLTDPPWRDNLLNVGYEWQGFGKPPQTQKSGNSVKVRGTVKLSSGGTFQAGERYRVMYLPGGRRPSGTRYFVIATSNANQPDSARATIDPDGSVYVRVSRSCAWISLDGIQFDID